MDQDNKPQGDMALLRPDGSKKAGGKYHISDLKEIMTRLRAPDGGCPWDIKQDFKSISPYTIEEAYEVVDAIDSGDRAALRDELGDLLFQVIYHAEMAREEGSFAFDDVVHAISSKLIRRHPHVFGSETLSSDEEIREMWQRIKRDEKTSSDSSKPNGLLADVPVALPGLTRAVKLQKKAAEVGFDWPAAAPVLEKLYEEIDELKEVLEAQAAKEVSPSPPAKGSTASLNANADLQQKSLEEFGDILFVMANLARHLRIDPEAAIRNTNEKFCRRFGYIEQQLAADGRSADTASLEEMEALWDAAKKLEH